MYFINCTPHTIRVFLGNDDKHFAIPKDGFVVRAVEDKKDEKSTHAEIDHHGTVASANGIRSCKMWEGMVKYVKPPTFVGTNVSEIPFDKWSSVDRGDPVVLVVSMLAAETIMKTKKDKELLEQENIVLLAPDTGPGSVVRSKKGEILGVRRFFRYM